MSKNLVVAEILKNTAQELVDTSGLGVDLLAQYFIGVGVEMMEKKHGLAGAIYLLQAHLNTMHDTWGKKAPELQSIRDAFINGDFK